MKKNHKTITFVTMNLGFQILSVELLQNHRPFGGLALRVSRFDCYTKRHDAISEQRASSAFSTFALSLTHQLAWEKKRERENKKDDY